MLQRIAYYFSDHSYGAQYIADVAKWSGLINEKVQLWRSRWDEAGSAPVPRLMWKTTGNCEVVYDSRSGREIEHVLDATSAAMLCYMTEPKRHSHILTAFDEPGAGERLESLQEAGLVFQEGDRYLSLVTGKSEHRSSIPAGVVARLECADAVTA